MKACSVETSPFKPQAFALLLLLGIGFAVRLGMLFWYLSQHGWAGETWEYEVIALNLLGKGEYSYPFHGTDYRSYVGPVFPILCYLLHLIGGKGLFLYHVFHLSIALTTIWLTYQLASKWFSPRTGLIAGLFVALEPGLIVYNSYKVDVLTLAMCLLLLGLALFDRMVSTGEYRWTALLGVLLGLSVMTRLDLIALLGPFLMWWAVARPWRVVVPHFLLVCAIALVVVSPWLARNYTVHGRVLFTTTAGEQLWVGNYEGTTGSSTPLTGESHLDHAPPAIKEALAHGTELQQYDAFRKEARRAIAADPAGFVQRAAGKFLAFWWFTPTYGLFYVDLPVLLRDGYKLLYLVLLLLAVAGAAMLWIEGPLSHRLPAWSALAAIFVVALIHSAYFVEGRHRILVMPLFLMFSAYGFQTLTAFAARLRQVQAPEHVS